MPALAAASGCHSTVMAPSANLQPAQSSRFTPDRAAGVLVACRHSACMRYLKNSMPCSLELGTHDGWRMHLWHRCESSPRIASAVAEAHPACVRGSAGDVICSPCALSTAADETRLVVVSREWGARPRLRLACCMLPIAYLWLDRSRWQTVSLFDVPNARRSQPHARDSEEVVRA